MNEVEDDIADTPYAVVDAPVMQIDRPSPEFVPDPPSPETNDFNPNESF
jgi:hypothetical protein